jgi:CO dehydrogenase maturation factor
VHKVRVVANKVRDDSDREFIRSRIPAEDLLGFMSYNADVIDADRKGLSPYDCSRQAVDEIRAIKAAIDAQE